MEIRKFLLILLLTLTTICSYSTDWDKATRKQFVKGKDYNIEFDMRHTSYCGLDSIEFVEYYSAKNNMTPENFAIILRLYKSQFVSKFNKCSKKKKINYPTQNPATNSNIYIKIIEITEKAGIKAEVTLYTDDISQGKQFSLNVNDGRWNTFDELLKENAEELAVKLYNRIRSSTQYYLEI